jgi:hypothetical protein
MQHNDIYKFLDSLTESKKAELFSDAVIEIFTKFKITMEENRRKSVDTETDDHMMGFGSGKAFAYSDALVILLGEDSEMH